MKIHHADSNQGKTKLAEKAASTSGPQPVLTNTQDPQAEPQVDYSHQGNHQPISQQEQDQQKLKKKKKMVVGDKPQAEDSSAESADSEPSPDAEAQQHTQESQHESIRQSPGENNPDMSQPGHAQAAGQGADLKATVRDQGSASIMGDGGNLSTTSKQSASVITYLNTNAERNDRQRDR